MINHKELRIGNLVRERTYHGASTVVRISFGDIECQTQYAGGPLAISGPGDKFDPIQLNVYWLERLGFKKKSSYTNHEYGNMTIFGTPDNIFYVQMGGKGNYLPVILYVHQLQNLYFALTREELIIGTEQP